jgi:hypothetical protein
VSPFFEEPLAPAALMPQLVNLRSVGVPLRAAERQGRGSSGLYGGHRWRPTTK